MKKFPILFVFALLSGPLFSTALLASAASASKQVVAEELIALTHSGERRLAPAKRVFDPARREAHFRKVAAGYYADKLSETELSDIVGFYRSGPGRRFLRTEDKIEKEIVIAAFSSILVPPSSAPKTSESKTAAVAEADAAPDPRVPLAEQLLKTPLFEERVERYGAAYEQMRASSPGAKPETAEEARDRIRSLYVERYSRRFSNRVLTELVAFYDSKVGRKYAKVTLQLPKYLEKESARYE